MFLTLKVILRDLKVFTTLIHAMGNSKIKKNTAFLF